MKMRRYAGMVWIVMAIVGIVGTSWGADVAKIGVIDFQKILAVSEAGKKAQEEIRNQGKKMEADLKKQGDELEEIRVRLERETLVMSKEKREEKERDFRIKVNDFKALQKKYAEDFKNTEKGLITKIQEEVMKIIEQVGKKEGYLLVLERREGGLLYFPGAIDMTDRIIQIYNESFSATSQKSEPAPKTPEKPKKP